MAEAAVIEARERASAGARRRRRRRVRTPTRLQMDATECGATALGIVLEYHGKFVPLSMLREQCGISRDGSKASNLLKAAQHFGFEGQGFKQEPEQLHTLPLPLILHWNFNHFVVLEGFGARRVFVNDPAVGPSSVSYDEFDRAFTGVVLSVQPAAAIARSWRRPPPFAALVPRVRGSAPAVAFLALTGLALMLPNLATPALTKVFVDDVLVAGNTLWLHALLAGLLLTALLRSALVALQRKYLVRVLSKLAVGMSSTFVWHALRLPVGFYLSRSPADLVERTTDNDTVANVLSERLSGVLLDCLLVAAYAALLFHFDRQLVWIALGAAGLNLALLRGAARVRADLSRRGSHDAAKLASVGAEGLQSIEAIKGSGAESDFFARWAGYQAKFAGVQQNSARREQWIAVATQLSSHLTSALVLGFGALRVMDGFLTIGTLVACQSLTASFMQPIEALARAGASLQKLRGSVERLDDVLEHRPDPILGGESAARKTGAETGLFSGRLELVNVTFGYLPLSRPLIDGLCLHVGPGQRIALVGNTGSGKSTISKLVCGLYKPWSGQILFDGRPRRALSRGTLTTSVALVDQEISLFEGSVRDNITLWDDSISEADCVSAAKDACIHDEISRRQGAYEARVIDGGLNFSAGQRQRLELARALCRRPALLVLDEATSALDPETERQVDENLRRRGCSCVIVAHRLSTIKSSDQIVVLESGRVVQSGTHEQLMREGGSYRTLISAD
jgi:NHLM bacteriocin system ABC transporter peptidase/ATP-binding protein